MQSSIMPMQFKKHRIRNRKKKDGADDTMEELCTRQLFNKHAHQWNSSRTHSLDWPCTEDPIATQINDIPDAVEKLKFRILELKVSWQESYLKKLGDGNKNQHWRFVWFMNINLIKKISCFQDCLIEKGKSMITPAIILVN